MMMYLRSAVSAVTLVFAVAGCFGSSKPTPADGPIPNDGSIYGEFNEFCHDNFGAESDPLYYEVFGNKLEFVESGSWKHESRNSAAIAFETSLPARSYVQFGPSTDYEYTTEVSDRNYFLHLHHLTGLEPNQTYHYRLVATDEQGKTLRSEDRTLTAQSMTDAVEIPGILEGPPYVLDQSDTTYILTQDIVSDTRGISVHGGSTGIVIDLNGFTITYDNGTPLVEPDSPQDSRHIFTDSDVSSVGIHWSHYNSSQTVTVRNGTIKQGANNGSGVLYGVGFNPILSRRGQWTVEGMVLDWSGKDVGGIWIEGGDLYAHHNVLQDRGYGITNRHLGVRVVASTGVLYGIHHNLVKRGRHMVFSAGVNQGEALHHYKNEIYSDSWSTNSHGLYSVGLVENNWIFGTGCHAQGIMFPYGGTENPIVRNNFIHLHGENRAGRCEAGSGTLHEQGRVWGIRLTQYPDAPKPQVNHLYEGNTVIIKTEETTTGKGVSLAAHALTENCVFRNNTVKVEVLDSDSPQIPCVASHGDGLLEPGDPAPPPVIYEGNTFITNSVFIHFGDGYTGGPGTHFRNNAFHRFSTSTDHYDIYAGVNWGCHSWNNRIIDSVLSGGADLENVRFLERGHTQSLIEYSVGHSLHIIAQRSGGGAVIADKTVEVTDNRVIGGFEVETDESGHARLELIEYSYVKPPDTIEGTKLTHSAHELRIDGYHPVVVTPGLFAISNNADDPEVVEFTPR